MQISSNDWQFLVGNPEILEQMPDVPALTVFSDAAVLFLSALSAEILHDKRTRKNPDVVSYAYWIRKASVERARENHRDHKNRIGRGVAFHIAPSNVPVNFAVSMTSSLLAGNATVIRLSSKHFEQADIICDAINKLLDTEYGHMKPYFCFLRYDHNEAITQKLSSLCDVRIIWGGNKTIEAIRKAALPPRAVEMTFADRHSLAVIDSEEYLKQDPCSVAKGFYTDTYYTDQNACSSPRLVVWTGKQVSKARKKFWDALDELVKKDYDMKHIQASDKYASFCTLAMSRKGIHLVSDNNYTVRVQADELTPDIMDYKDSSGYFFEYVVKEDLEEIIPVLTKQCQTVSVLGVSKEEIRKIVFDNGVRGVDRIVSLGQTMGLEFVWDGYKMIEAMSRIVYLGENL
ncbi:MAG: acyl-CoA reductase [Porcipelethomonas sp.]